MAEFRIVCTTQEPPQVPNDRAHIVRVGTGVTASAFDGYWRLGEVLAAMDRGHIFYTFGESSRRRALVEKYICPWSAQVHIRSTPDTVADNNLDSLETCQP